MSKRVCKDAGEAVINRTIPDLLDGIGDMADRFKKIYIFFLGIDPNLNDAEKENLSKEFEEQSAQVKDISEKLKKTIECDPEDTSEKKPPISSFGDKKITWILESPGFGRNQNGCTIGGQFTKPIVQNGNSLSGRATWNLETNGRLQSTAVNITGTITDSGQVHMEITGADFPITYDGVVNRIGEIVGTARGCGETSGSFIMRRR